MLALTLILYGWMDGWMGCNVSLSQVERRLTLKRTLEVVRTDQNALTITQPREPFPRLSLGFTWSLISGSWPKAVSNVAYFYFRLHNYAGFLSLHHSLQIISLNGKELSSLPAASGCMSEV